MPDELNSGWADCRSRRDWFRNRPLRNYLLPVVGMESATVEKA